MTDHFINEEVNNAQCHYFLAQRTHKGRPYSTLNLTATPTETKKNMFSDLIAVHIRTLFSRITQQIPSERRFRFFAV